MRGKRNRTLPDRTMKNQSELRLRIITAALAASALTAGCDVQRNADGARPGDGIPVAPAAARGYNVLLITLDTVRADHIGCYGYPHARTPTIDSLSSIGVRFADAVTPVPITLPSHASILTGADPPAHGVRLNGVYRLEDRPLTLTETLARAGYETAAFIGASVLDRSMGLDRGFDHYDDVLTAPGQPMRNSAERPANRVTSVAIAWLRARADASRPFFAWVHYFDPHDPYEPPAPFADEFRERPYDGEIAFMDRELGRLLHELRARGAADRTVTVLVSDHGEGLGEHGERTHAHLVYETTLHVPFIVVPGGLLTTPVVVADRIVATTDIAPTVLDLLGVAADSMAIDGASLLDARADPDRDRDRAVYVETLWPHLVHGWAPIHGLRRHVDKYIEAPIPEYYDLNRDPGEKENLLTGVAGDEGAMLGAASALRRALEALLSEAKPIAPALEPDSETVERLMSLGYVMPARGAPPAREPGGARRPLREMIREWQARSDSILASPARQAQNMVAMQARVVALEPGNSAAHLRLGHTLLMLKRYEEAAEAYVTAARLDSTNPAVWLSVAEARGAAGDWERFDDALEQAEAKGAPPCRIDLLRGRRRMAEKDYAGAARIFEQAAKSPDPACRGQSVELLRRARRLQEQTR
jgi:arylsulfatase A-like enzyme